MDKVLLRKNQVITLNRKDSAKVDGTAVRLDPQLLFQLLVFAAKAIDYVESVLKYEVLYVVIHQPFLITIFCFKTTKTSASQCNMGSYEHIIPP